MYAVLVRHLKKNKRQSANTILSVFFRPFYPASVQNNTLRSIDCTICKDYILLRYFNITWFKCASQVRHLPILECCPTTEILLQLRLHTVYFNCVNHEHIKLFSSTPAFERQIVEKTTLLLIFMSFISSSHFRRYPIHITMRYRRKQPANSTL